MCYSDANSQVPNLYSLNNFSVFTSVGAITNTGLTNIIGDIGTNVGAFTGFPPGNVTGSIHVADSVSVIAAVYMDSIYAQIGRMSCDTSIDSTIGPNQTIYPGVNCIGSAAILSGIVTFDGLSKKDAMFIVKIDGAFNTSNLSQIRLYDSANSKNIFWLINGAVILGDSSIFMGNIIANGAITISNFTTIHGKALSRSGAISINNSLIDTSRQMNPLTIMVTNYSIKLIGKTVLAKWQLVTNSQESSVYNLERSIDGYIWEIVNTCSESLDVENPEFILVDLNPLDNQSFYRLSIIENGVTKNLKIHIINNVISHNSLIYPNPNNGQFKITDSELGHSVTNFRIYSSKGELVFSSIEYLKYIDISPIGSGLYIIYYIKDEKQFSEKFNIVNM